VLLYSGVPSNWRDLGVINTQVVFLGVITAKIGLRKSTLGADPPGTRRPVVVVISPASLRAVPADRTAKTSRGWGRAALPRLG